MKREEAIRDLDIIRFNPHWDEFVNEEYWQELMEMAITALQNEPVWIPVSERLPEESGSYLTWVRYDNEEFMSIEDIDCEGIFKEWNFTGKVLYWMPLPEPYRESEPHKQTKADEIRSMTDEELADFIINFDNRFGEEYEGEQSCLAWLQKESEETK